MAKRFENRRIYCVYFKNGKIDVSKSGRLVMYAHKSYAVR